MEGKRKKKKTRKSASLSLSHPITENYAIYFPGTSNYPLIKLKRREDQRKSRVHASGKMHIRVYLFQ